MEKKLEHEGENVNLIDGHELIQFIIYFLFFCGYYFKWARIMNRLYRVGIIKFPCGIVFMTLVTATQTVTIAVKTQQQQNKLKSTAKIADDKR